ncbi:MAG: proliferating cell nuclear antigen (pcna) [Candidatus Aenigmarchaeota archaeon]|nr:proliferating cell nuclear antigen (pcna) [Candidatus Aenigmarchaeota archaeon]
MFKATLTEPKLFVDSILTIGELIDEGIFKISKDGIRLKATDRAMVAAIDFKILANAFDSFEVEEKVDMGLSVTNLISILKRIRSGDKLAVELKDARLEIVIQNSSRRKFTLPLIELKEEELPQIEQLEFSCGAELKSDALQAGLEDAEVVADSVVIIASPGKFRMLAEGDISRTEFELEKGVEALININAKEEMRARYPLDYLKKMIKASKISDKVKLEWGKDFPIRLEFKAGDKGSLSFVVAPRVEE